MSAQVLLGEEGIARAVEVLRRGDVVGLPTETVYGLAGDAFAPLAIARIFEAKKRPLSDPLIVHLPEAGWLTRVARFDSEEQRNRVEQLAVVFWPGPLTLILPKHPDLCDLVTAGMESVAVRVTAHPVFQQILRTLGSPIAAPSANRFGRISPTSAEDVRMELGDAISLIVDGGDCLHGMESTIVALRGEEFHILRPGPVTKDQLIQFGHVVSLGGNGNTPGNLPGHYAPKNELQILEADINGIFPKPETGLLSFRSPSPEIAGRFAALEVLSDTGDLREAAANFYGALRRLDQRKLVKILATPLPEEGIGVAIMDRLRRASYGSKYGSGAVQAG